MLSVLGLKHGSGTPVDLGKSCVDFDKNFAVDLTSSRAVVNSPPLSTTSPNCASLPSQQSMHRSPSSQTHTLSSPINALSIPCRSHESQSSILVGAERVCSTIDFTFFAAVKLGSAKRVESTCIWRSGPEKARRRAAISDADLEVPVVCNSSPH